MGKGLVSRSSDLKGKLVSWRTFALILIHLRQPNCQWFRQHDKHKKYSLWIMQCIALQTDIDLVEPLLCKLALSCLVLSGSQCGLPLSTSSSAGTNMHMWLNVILWVRSQTCSHEVFDHLSLSLSNDFQGLPVFLAGFLKPPHSKLLPLSASICCFSLDAAAGSSYWHWWGMQHSWGWAVRSMS